MPATDSYIEKEAIINEEIDRLRLSATRSLFERRDVIIVASVSCIYGLGSPEAYYGLLLPLEKRPADRSRRDPAQARRDSVRAQRSRVHARHLPRPRRHRRGLSVVRRRRPADRACSATRSTSCCPFDPLTGREVRRHDRISVYPKSHFVAPRARTQAGDRVHQGRADGSGWPSSRAPAACSRRSGCTSGRCSISR